MVVHLRGLSGGKIGSGLGLRRGELYMIFRHVAEGPSDSELEGLVL